MPSFFITKIPQYDPELDTIEDLVSRTIQLTNKNFDTLKRLLYGQLDNVNIRSGGIFLEDLTGGLMPIAPDNLVQGLNLTPQFMGYFDGDNWTTYINDQGDFYFKGDDDNYLIWDGNTLDIKGTLNAVTGTFDVLGAGTFPDGSRILLGEVAGEPKIELYDGEDNLRFTIEKDRINFITDRGQLAGFIQGIHMETEEVPSFLPAVNSPVFMVESPEYIMLNAIADTPVGWESPGDPPFDTQESFTKQARVSASVAPRIDETYPGSCYIFMEAVNLSDPFLPLTFSQVVLDHTGIDLFCGWGSVKMYQRLFISSPFYEQHIQLKRDSNEHPSNPQEKVGTLKITLDNDYDRADIVLEDDTSELMIWKDTDPLMVIDEDELFVWGNLSASGSKPAVVDTENYGRRKLYAVEAPDVRFCDVIETELTGGTNHIEIDPMFSETIGDYIVHTSLNGPGYVIINSKEKTGFTVNYSEKAKCKATFLVYGLRLGYEEVYMEEKEEPKSVKERSSTRETTGERRLADLHPVTKDRLFDSRAGVGSGEDTRATGQVTREESLISKPLRVGKED